MGSPRVEESTRFLRADKIVGYLVDNFFRPPPRLRILVFVIEDLADNSDRPVVIVFLDKPVARETIETPP